MASLYRFLCRWAIVAGVAATVASLMAFGGQWWWYFELCTHFRPHYAAALGAAAIACWTLKHGRFAVLFGIGAMYNLALIVPLYVPAQRITATAEPVRLLLANVHVRNRRHASFLKLVEESSPDIIVTIEVNSRWLTALDTVANFYPYRIHHPREDSFGIAVLSRLPAELLEVRWIGPSDVPSVLAKFALGERGEFYLVATHPLPPVSAERAAERNEHLIAVGELVGTLDGPVVLAGDLNITSWSPFFRDLVAASKLRDSRRGRGIQPTWPGPCAWLGVPIDHVLVSHEVAILRREVGPQIGSDHRPVVVDLVVPPATP